MIYLESHNDSGIQYKLYECKECGVQFWEPFKNPGAEWYEKDERYATRSIEPDIEFKKNYKEILNFLKTFKGKVLDVGCGTGGFLFWAQKGGWDVYGIDFDKGAVSAAKNILKLENVEVNDVIGYREQNSAKKFDLITFFDVLEHLDNPNEFMDAVKSMLKKGGYVAMNMPYSGMVRWLNPHDLPPRHLTRWDRESLKRFLERHGFKVLYIKRKPASLTHILMKLRFKYGKFFSFNLVRRLKSGEVHKNSDKVHKVKKVYKVLLLARIKDWIIFGIPAIFIWLSIFFSRKRYASLYAIAQKI